MAQNGHSALRMHSSSTRARMPVAGPLSDGKTDLYSGISDVPTVRATKLTPGGTPANILPRFAKRLQARDPPAPTLKEAKPHPEVPSSALPASLPSSPRSSLPSTSATPSPIGEITRDRRASRSSNGSLHLQRMDMYEVTPVTAPSSSASHSVVGGSGASRTLDVHDSVVSRRPPVAMVQPLTTRLVLNLNSKSDRSNAAAGDGKAASLARFTGITTSTSSEADQPELARKLVLVSSRSSEYDKGGVIGEATAVATTAYVADGIDITAMAVAQSIYRSTPPARAEDHTTTTVEPTERAKSPVSDVPLLPSAIVLPSLPSTEAAPERRSSTHSQSMAVPSTASTSTEPIVLAPAPRRTSITKERRRSADYSPSADVPAGVGMAAAVSAPTSDTTHSPAAAGAGLMHVDDVHGPDRHVTLPVTTSEVDVGRLASLPEVRALNAAALADIDADIPEINGYMAGNVQGRHEFRKTTVLPDTNAMLPTFAPGSPFDLAMQARVVRHKRIHKPEALKRLQQGDEEFEKKKAAKALGKIINKYHKQYQTSFGMMLGIYTSVVNTQVGAEKMLLEDFMKVRKLVFPPSGSPLTPPHTLPTSFKFKDYAPKVFHHLRQRFAIDQKHYLNSLGGAYEYIEFNSNSKSGSFFFYSHDGKFMIKTQSSAESKFLRRILAHYYQYVMTHPHTYITRFYGMHRIKMPHLRKKIHFVVMQSVFYGDNDIHEMYDLKGSTVGRCATEKEKARGADKCVFKDMDLVRSNTRIKLGPARREAFLEQIRQDSHFLQRMKIMDYSLLLGIHYRSKREIGAPHALVHFTGPDTARGDTSASETKLEDGSAVTHASLHMVHEETAETATAKHARNTSSFTPAAAARTAATPAVASSLLASNQAVLSRSTSNEDRVLSPGQVLTAAFGDAAESLRTQAHMRQHEAYNTSTVGARGGGVLGFAAHMGGLSHTGGPGTRGSMVVSKPVEPPHPSKEAGMGVLGLLADGTVADEIYYLGIIDILQQYDMRKMSETAIKSLYQGYKGISAVGPSFYAERFVNFLAEHTT